MEGVLTRNGQSCLVAYRGNGARDMTSGHSKLPNRRGGWNSSGGWNFTLILINMEVGIAVEVRHFLIFKRVAYMHFLKFT